MEEEKWKWIEGYEGLYQISSLGRVKSFKYGEKLLKTPKNGAGYFTVNLYKDGHMKGYFVHRLVAENFIENPLNLPQINHKDENKTNNRPNNLEWCTNEYNQKYGSHNKNVISTMRKKHSQAFYVIAKDGTDYFFPSINEAGKELNLDTRSVSSCLKGKRKTHYGYTFELCE